MLFNSEAYLIFLPIVLLLYWLAPVRFRGLLLLVASYIFYMTWKPEYGILMAAATLFNYIMGLMIARSDTKKRPLVISAVVANLLLLAFFKYAYFGRDFANSIVGLAGVHLPEISLKIILPLAISFFVFEFIHYVVDVYRGHKPIKNFIHFALFPSFFPTQIAGPIKRYQDFVPQIEVPRKFNLQTFDEGFERLLFGLFKKVIIADSFGLVVDAAFSNVSTLSTLDWWLAAYAFTFQLYFDFSGYTDIARGSAQLLGFSVPLNFDMPLIANSIGDFWRRWHITLSNWLRDYLYIPLGGNRGSKLATYRNLLITMTLCGLWHGAAMHFVFYGLYNGLFLCLHKEWQKLVARTTIVKQIVETKLFHLFAIWLTFQITALGFVVFRAETVDTAVSIYGKMLNVPAMLSDPNAWKLTIINAEGPPIFGVLPLALALCFLCQILCSGFRKNQGLLPFPKQAMALKVAYLAALIGILAAFSPDATPRFIYFQF